MGIFSPLKLEGRSSLKFPGYGASRFPRQQVQELRLELLQVRNKQFAVVENPGLWNWTFTLKDEVDNTLAQIDRDWRGFGLELFTDAGQYVIRFGNTSSSPKIGLDSTELKVTRPLTLLERAVAVALAISLDNDFFSRTGGGWGLPILIAGE